MNNEGYGVKSIPSIFIPKIKESESDIYEKLSKNVNYIYKVKK